MNFNLISYLHRQREFSSTTFGPGTRLKGVLKHIRKEMVEVEKDPQDVFEWCDIMILTMDGALRQGHDPKAICDALEAKYQRNAGRTWPDWRTMDEDEAIEHVRTDVVSPEIGEEVLVNDGGIELAPKIEVESSYRRKGHPGSTRRAK